MVPGVFELETGQVYDPRTRSASGNPASSNEAPNCPWLGNTK